MSEELLRTCLDGHIGNGPHLAQNSYRPKEGDQRKIDNPQKASHDLLANRKHERWPLVLQKIQEELREQGGQELAIERLELWKTNWSVGIGERTVPGLRVMDQWIFNRAPTLSAGETVPAGETEEDGSMKDLLRIIEKEGSLRTPEMGGVLLVKPIPDVDGRSPDLEQGALDEEERMTK